MVHHALAVRRITEHGTSSIQDALDVEAAGSSHIARISTEEQFDRKTCWEEGVGSNSALPAFVITTRQTGATTDVGPDEARVVL